MPRTWTSAPQRWPGFLQNKIASNRLIAPLLLLAFLLGGCFSSPETNAPTRNGAAHGTVTLPSYTLRLLQGKRMHDKPGDIIPEPWHAEIDGMAVSLYNTRGQAHTVIHRGNDPLALAETCRTALRDAPPSHRMEECRVLLNYLVELEKAPIPTREFTPQRNCFEEFQPGFTGMLVTQDDELLSWWLPEETITLEMVEDDNLQQEFIVKIMREKRGKTGWNIPDAVFHTFRVRGFLQDKPGGDGLLPLSRGNVLLPDVPDAAAIESACERMEDYFERTIDGEGRFIYTYLPVKRSADQRGYNHLRHCGAIFSMLEWYERSRDEATLAGAKRALGYILGYVPPRDEGNEYRFLMDLPEKSGKQDIKLGGAGLLLLALCQYQTVTGDTQYADLRRDLAAFILFMQKENGDFHAYYDRAAKSGISGEFSIYYPGEAALGLIRYYLIDGTEADLDAAGKAIDFLCSREHKSDPNYIQQVKQSRFPNNLLPDAWRMMAMQEYAEIRESPRFLDECLALADVMLLHQYDYSDTVPPDFIGAPRQRTPSTISSGSRKEGLVAAWHAAHMKKDSARCDAILRGLLESTRFAMSQQFRPENSYFLSRDSLADGGIRLSPVDNGIRNDGVQHNLSGMLGLLEILEQNP